MIGESPGFGADPSFFNLVRHAGGEPLGSTGPAGGEPLAALPPHGTTVVALRFAEGVIMAGDRRAVEGYAIAATAIEHRLTLVTRNVRDFAGIKGLRVRPVA
jgi:proteasome beta subunit